MVNCPVCNGTGFVYVMDNNWGYTKPPEEKCHACEGFGNIDLTKFKPENHEKLRTCLTAGDIRKGKLSISEVVALRDMVVYLSSELNIKKGDLAKAKESFADISKIIDRMNNGSN